MHVNLLSSEAFFEPNVQQISFSRPTGHTRRAYSASLQTPSWIRGLLLREGEGRGGERRGNLSSLNFPSGYTTGDRQTDT